MQIIYTTEFQRLFRKLPSELQIEAKKREIIFRKNPFDSRLKTHKLSGEFNGCWAFSISHSDRVIFEFEKGGIAYFHLIGDHDIYK